MKNTTGKPRIVGVSLGEASLNFIKPGIPPITAVFGLVRDDDELAGRVEKRLEWSEKTMQALGVLQDCMEIDMLAALFDVPASSPDTEPEQV